MYTHMRKMLFLFNAPAMQLRQVLIDDFSAENFACCVALPEEDIALWQEKYPKVQFVPFNGFSGTSIGILENLKTFWRIKKLIKSVKPDVVFLGNVKPNIYGGIAAHRCGIKNIYGLISGLGYAFVDEPGFKRSLVKRICLFLYKHSFKHFTHVFFQNNDDRNLFLQKHVVKEESSSVVAGTGVDLATFTPQPFPEKTTFFMAARLIKEKGVFHFVEATKRLKDRYPDVEFVLGGNIDSNPSAITQKQLEDCSHFVKYIGYIKNMSEAMAKCSVFVYPSYYREGVPRTLLEALACGRPVITTENVGCREAVVDGDNGYKIAIKDTEALAKAMENFITNASNISIMGNNSRRLAENKFDIHRVNQQIYDTVEGSIR